VCLIGALSDLCLESWAASQNAIIIIIIIIIIMRNERAALVLLIGLREFPLGVA
jgi:uncharacterized integral membrane protein